MKDDKIDRLLRAAAPTGEDVPPSMPFGFDTRVVARWRASANKPNGLTGLFRRVAVVSAAVIALSTVAAFREIQRNRETGESFSNEFAIADSAIQDEFPQ